MIGGAGNNTVADACLADTEHPLQQATSRPGPTPIPCILIYNNHRQLFTIARDSASLGLVRDNFLQLSLIYFSSAWRLSASHDIFGLVSLQYFE